MKYGSIKHKQEMYMKIFRIQVSGLKLFQKEIIIDFYAKQRVPADKNEMLTNIFSNIYINNVISLVGINASGKTSSLKVISFVLNMLKNEPINKIKYNEILEGLEEQDEVIFNTYFTDANQMLKLSTVIKSKNSITNNKYYISRENISAKSLNSIRSKKDLFNFTNIEPMTERNQEELFLLDDVSVIIAFNKKQKNSLFFIDSLDWTDNNGLQVLGNFPIALVQFLDPTIEHLYYEELDKDEKKIEIRLKFFNKKEVVLHSTSEMSKYLSSGTVKGINVFMTAIFVLKKGGYLIVDEIENHFNKEIVSTLIRFFMDSEINTSGAVLIFSTHYIELLDIFERNDNIYLLKNKNGINIENFADLLKRNDVKKSELFKSGYLENTTPSYESFINLKKAIVKIYNQDKV
jgi:predicted ATPase